MFPRPTECLGVDGGTAWKFESIANALINQDMGCLNQIFNLGASVLSLAHCALCPVNVERRGTVGIDWREDHIVEVFTLGK